MQVPPDFDLSAASLRAEGAQLGTVVEALAAKLELTLPGRTVVRRRARGLLSRERRVREVEVSLPAASFRLDNGDGQIACWRQKVVGGISIKREPLMLGDWLAALTEELDASSGETARARAELERLLS